MRHDELAPCGVFCGACPAFGKSCRGCASEDRDQRRRSKWGCRIRNCCYDRQVLDYCVHCGQFPCKVYEKKLLTAHPDDPAYTYRFEIPLFFPELKKTGVENYIEFQKKRHTCESCGGTVRFYHYRCDKCGKAWKP